MASASDEDLAEQVTLPRAEDSFGDVDDLDPAIGEFVRELGRGPTGGDSSPKVKIAEGARLAEHFQVLRRIGSGGMGVVVLARDLRLDREVAIKLVGASSSEQAAARLQREAQAMAQLAHPNVVAVHEVGTVGGTVYIAMEYVEGGTARSWAKAQPRTWPEIVDVYLQAARGLAAAHAAGLVHRDFKPDNVLVGRDGRVRVADFGLARSRVSDSSSRTADTPIVAPPDHASFQHATLTATDAVVGTPGYMAPEQFANRDVGPPADQFAFAVAMYEALYGERPYGPHAALPEEELVMRPGSPDKRVPAWLRRILVRALAPRPEQRFVDMQVVVRALERGRTRTARMRTGALAIIGAAVVAGVGLGIGRELRGDPCDSAVAGAEAVWPAARATAIAEAVGPAGSDAWAGLAPRTAAWIEEWSQARRDSCTATRVDGTRSDALLDRSFACFDERLQEADAWLDLLENGDPSAIRAIGERDVLPDFTACGDTAYLLAQVDRPADPLVAQRVDELTAELIAVQVKHRAGARARARDELARLEAPIEATGYAPLHAGWLALRGNIALTNSEFADAQRDLQESYVEARTVGANARAAGIALDLAFLHGVQKHDTGVARVWLDHVGIDVARGVAPGHLAVAMESIEAIIAGQDGRFDEAIVHGERAVELADTELGVFARIEARKALATALDVAGRHRESIALFEAVLAEIDGLLGTDAIARLPVLTNLGLAYYQVGRYDDAIAKHELALAITRRAVGDDHVDVWTSEFNLGLALVAAGRYDEATSHLSRARALVERLGPDFEADQALVLSSLGWLADKRGELEKALAIYREALAMHRRQLPEGHPEIALQLTRIAELSTRLGHLDDANARLDEALAIWAQTANADQPQRAETWLALARLERARGRTAEARRRYEAVLELAATADVLPEITAGAKEELAMLK